MTNKKQIEREILKHLRGQKTDLSSTDINLGKSIGQIMRLA